MWKRRCVNALAGLLLAAATSAVTYAGELELKPETLKIWNEYEHAADLAMQQRLNNHCSLLPAEQSPDLPARLRSGEIVVWPASKSPKPVPSGLIHDWFAAGFIPNARIADVISVVRDYRQYSKIYKPGVLDARLLSRSGGEDQFAAVLRNMSFFTKTALEGVFNSTFTRVDEGRWYSVTRVIRLQEINDYGESTQHKLPPDRGHGYIWRMTSLSKMEERDGGVYVDEEVMALTRDVPATLRWMAGPIIRRMARASTASTVEKTRAAVESRPEVISAAKKPVDCGRAAAASCWR